MRLTKSELKKQIVIMVRRGYDGLRSYVRKENSVFLLVNEYDPKILLGLQERLDFYLPQVSINIIEANRLQRSRKLANLLFNVKPVLVWADWKCIPGWLFHGRGGFYNINFERNPTDGWEWAALAAYTGQRPMQPIPAMQRFETFIRALKTKHSFEKTYVFGTGPSLAKAEERDWSDGFRIVCNTIVRDPKLWAHIDPHLIVASDAIYHFGHTEFAKAFRRDLKIRLQEGQAWFAFPDLFLEIVLREFEEFSDRLLPIPYGESKVIGKNLVEDFGLPALGNVLPLMLLPLACTLSKMVYLWGFDGRAPQDTGFWSNSTKHHYGELMGELQKAHPGFYNHFIPQSDPFKYIRETQGEVLDSSLREAEAKGWQFVMMHPSFTPVLQERYIK